MKNLFSAILIVITMSASAQVTIEGVTLPATLSANSESLVLNGGGLREKFFLDLYVGGLYLTAKSSDAAAIIKADKAMAITLDIVSGLIDSDKMTSATNEGFEKSTKGNIQPIATEIGQFIAVFKEEIKVGDVYHIKYTPGKGTVVFKNNKKSATIKGLAFKQALFGIWLGEEPADDDLKEGMLGE